MQGYISLHREIQDHWIYQENRVFSRYEAWLDMLMMANHAPGKFVHGNEMIEVERGSFISSEMKLMERWDWGKSKIRAFFSLLESDAMIIKKSDTKKTTFFLLNYDKYQRQETTDKPRTNHRRTTSKPPSDTNNNDNNSNNENNKETIYISEFSKEFQELYESWLKDRKTRKKPVTEKAMELQLKRCREWGEQKSSTIIKKAIEKSWLGLEDYDSKDIPKPKGVDYEAEKKKTLEREKAANEAKRQEQAEKDLKRREDDKILRWLDSLPESKKEQIETEINENHMVTRLRMPPDDAPESEKESQMNIINSAKKMVRITLARKYYFQDNQ